MITVELDYDPNDSWALVELSRWQTGELPNPDSPPLDISLALKHIANNIEKNVKSHTPEHLISPSNLVSILRYLSKHYQFS